MRQQPITKITLDADGPFFGRQRTQPEERGAHHDGAQQKRHQGLHLRQRLTLQEDPLDDTCEQRHLRNRHRRSERTQPDGDDQEAAKRPNLLGRVFYP